ncbi:carbohydrate binding domain-containing protein [Candidatus Poribacteria bacterium]
MEIDDLEAHTGSKSFRIAADDATRDSTSAMLVHSRIPMENDGVYTIAFWAKVDENDAQSRPIRVSVEEKANVESIYAEDIILDSTDWKEYTLTFAAEGTTRGVRIKIGISQVAVNFWLDDFRFFEGTPSDEFMSDAILTLVSRDRPVAEGDRFDLGITVAEVTNMHKFNLKLAFDPEVLEVEKVDEASFASWWPRPKHMEAVDLFSRTIVDNSAGTVTIACNSTRAGGVSGSGDIATIGFHAIGAGATSLGFHGVSLIDSNGRRIKAELNIPEIQVMGFHSMDVNHDGVVNILDFVAIASADDGSSQAAPRVQTGLGQNYPNPFNPETWIPYQLAQPSHVIIRIYRSTGELTRMLDLGTQEAGLYADKMKAAYWDGRNDAGEQMSSGVYFCTIQAGEFAATRKMTIAR